MDRSAFCPSQGHDGFTLLELLIVMAILGAIAAVVGPSLSGTYDRIRFSLQRESVERQIAALPRQAQGKGRSLILAATKKTLDGSGPAFSQTANISAGGQLPADAAVLALPLGWSVVVETPIRYNFDGFCSGGRLMLASGSFQARYELDAPLCQPRALQ
jgi:general secretion pathway protein G